MTVFSRKRMTLAAAVCAVVLVAVAAVWWITGTRGPGDYRITAHVESSTGIYAGDEVTVLGVPVGTIKRHATGKGNANKDAMIAAVRSWGYTPVDDNEADALALLHWAIAQEIR